jgi:hypothetical protein
MALLSFLAVYYYLLNRRRDEQRERYRNAADEDLRQRGFVPEASRRSYQNSSNNTSHASPAPYHQPQDQEFPSRLVNATSEYPFPPYSSPRHINSPYHEQYPSPFSQPNHQSSYQTSYIKSLQRFTPSPKSPSNLAVGSSSTDTYGQPSSNQVLHPYKYEALAYGPYVPSHNRKHRSKSSYQPSHKNFHRKPKHTNSSRS